jgi:hypothetical protein
MNLPLPSCVGAACHNNLWEMSKLDTQRAGILVVPTDMADTLLNESSVGVYSVEAYMAVPGPFKKVWVLLQSKLKVLPGS